MGVAIALLTAGVSIVLATIIVDYIYFSNHTFVRGAQKYLLNAVVTGNYSKIRRAVEYIKVYCIIPWIISFYVQTDPKLKDIYEKTGDIPFEVGLLWAEDALPLLVEKLGLKRAKDAIYVLSRLYTFLLKKKLIKRTPLKEYVKHYGSYLLGVFDSIASERNLHSKVPDWL